VGESVQDLLDSHTEEEVWAIIGPQLAISLSDLLLVVDAEGIILYLNRAEGGVPRHRVIGSCVFDYVPPGLRADLARSLAEIFGGAGPRVREVPTTLPDGTRRWYRTLTTALVRDRAVFAATIVARDLTEALAAQRAARDTETQSRAMFTIIGGMVHDFNNVLATILLSAGELQSGTTPSATTAPAVAAIVDATQRGTVLMDRLVNFAWRCEAVGHGVKTDL
jgi:PAS domain S-box-containing protein